MPQVRDRLSKSFKKTNWLFEKKRKSSPHTIHQSKVQFQFKVYTYKSKKKNQKKLCVNKHVSYPWVGMCSPNINKRQRKRTKALKFNISVALFLKNHKAKLKSK